MLDIGTSSIRAGYAGDDTPKAVIPTSYGYTEEADAPNGQDVSMTDAADPSQTTSVGASSGSKKVKLHIGQHGPSMFRPNMHVGNPMKDGLSESITLRRPASRSKEAHPVVLI